MTTKNNDERIKHLLYKIEKNTASKSEKEEYTNLLFKEGYISEDEYTKYKKELEDNIESPNLMKTLVGIGLAIFLGFLLKRAFTQES